MSSPPYLWVAQGGGPLAARRWSQLASLASRCLSSWASCNPTSISGVQPAACTNLGKSPGHDGVVGPLVTWFVSNWSPFHHRCSRRCLDEIGKDFHPARPPEWRALHRGARHTAERDRPLCPEPQGCAQVWAPQPPQKRGEVRTLPGCHVQALPCPCATHGPCLMYHID